MPGSELGFIKVLDIAVRYPPGLYMVPAEVIVGLPSQSEKPYDPGICVLVADPMFRVAPRLEVPGIPVNLAVGREDHAVVDAEVPGIPV